MYGAKLLFNDNYIQRCAIIEASHDLPHALFNLLLQDRRMRHLFNGVKVASLRLGIEHSMRQLYLLLIHGVLDRLAVRRIQ